MTYLRTNNTRPNALHWPLGLGDLEKQLDTIFAGLPAFFDVQEGASAQGQRAQDAKLRWYEKADAYLVRVDLPGVKKEDASIELEDGTVTVSAVRKLEAAGSEQAKEVRYEKAFRVPEGVSEAGISGRFEDGVLSLTLPKTEKAQPRSISIN